MRRQGLNVAHRRAFSVVAYAGLAAVSVLLAYLILRLGRWVDGTRIPGLVFGLACACAAVGVVTAGVVVWSRLELGRSER